MSRNHWFMSFLGLTLALVLSASGAITPPNALVSAAPSGAAVEPVHGPISVAYHYWSFAAKFVCGYQPTLFEQPGWRGEPPVKPGNYATEINIHNYQYIYRAVPLRKKVLVLVDQGKPVGREPQQAAPRAFDTIELAPDGATMDDCNRIWELLYPTTPPPTPMPLMIGYLVILSPVDLDVDVVYTAEVYTTHDQNGQIFPDFSSPTGIAEDVERVPGKRVYIPQHNFPGGALARPQLLSDVQPSEVQP